MGGTAFGEYQLVRLLTQGKRTEVYLALNEHNPALPRDLALKKLLHEDGDPAERHPRLPADDSPSWQLEHPNIVEVLGRGQVDDSLFVLTEFVDGPDLGKLLSTSLHRQLPVPHSVIHYLAGQIVAALAYAEASTDKAGTGRGVVHRNIFPSVVLLSYDGAVKLDGLELALDPDCPGSPPDPAFTHSAYMSPEQVRGEQLNVASDIFSFGVVLYEIMTGARLFARDSDHQSRLAVLAGRVPSPGSLRPSLDPALVSLVERCLCPEPKDRYPTARSLQDAITDAASRATELGDSESLTQFLRKVFPAQMARRGVLPGDGTETAAPEPALAAPLQPTEGTKEVAPEPVLVAPPQPPKTVSVPRSRPPEALSAEHMAITTAEFQTSLADPRRARLVGRPDAAPPGPPSLPPPPARAQIEHRDLEDDPFKLGAMLESEEEGQHAPSLAAEPNDPSEDIDPPSSSGRPSRLWLLPLGAALAVLTMVVGLGGPTPELSAELRAGANDSTLDAPNASQDPNKTGILTVESSPWAYVSINGVLREWITPTRLELPPGTHTIGLFHPATDWRIERTVTIQPGEELLLNVTR